MSSNNNNKVCNKVCKVCRDAGKPESVFTSHFVKDSKNGVVICPTLLNTVCRYCRQSGHTVKYCSSLKNKTMKTEQKEVVEKKIKLEINININRFGALSIDVDDEDVVFPPPPVLTRHTPKRWIDYDSDSDIEQEN